MARRDISGAVDFAHLEGYAAGDDGLVEEVLSIFTHQAELWIRLLDPRGDPSAWRDGAHTLKGASLGVGAFTLAEVCSQAEQGHAAGPGERAVMLEHIRDALNAALADIAAYTHERALNSLKSPRS